MTIEQTIHRIRAYKTENGIKNSTLAVEAGLSNMALRNIDNKDWNPTAEVLRKVEAIIPPEYVPDQTRTEGF